MRTTGPYRVLTATLTAAGVLAVGSCSSAQPGEREGSKDAGSDGTSVSVELTSDSCEASRLSVPAGKVTFRVRGGGSGAVTELEVQKSGRILTERENIAPGLTADLSVTLDPGSYALYCPGGGGPDTRAFNVTTPTSTPPTSTTPPS